MVTAAERMAVVAAVVGDRPRPLNRAVRDLDLRRVGGRHAEVGQLVQAHHDPATDVAEEGTVADVNILPSTQDGESTGREKDH